MPLYLYRCERCGYEVELQRSLALRNAPTTCDVPGHPFALAWRVLTPPAIRGETVSKS